MSVQRCPNCREQNDVSVYVHGQLARCSRCGIRFAVDRESPISNPNAARSPAPPLGPLSSAATRVPDPHTVVTTVPGGAGAVLPKPVEPVAPPPPVDPPAKRKVLPEQIYPTAADRPIAARAPAAPDHVTDIGGAGSKRPILPGYDSLDLLGRGGMGEVWRARQHSLNRTCAIKILSPTLAVEPDFVRRFERESNALAALSHPNIVTIYDRGSANGYWYFVMEFVEGRSLRDRLESRPPRNELLRILTQVAKAVDHAHKKGVIHRDLKPDNVLIDHIGDAKVADFGLAGMSETGRSSLTMEAVAMGTAHYMAPEQRRDAKNVDGRADLYSLGVMLYEAVCGELPQGKFQTPRERVPDLDKRLDKLIMGMLDQDPEKRPGRASEIVEVLDAVRAGPAPDAQSPERPAGPALSSMIGRVRESRPQQALLASAGVLLIAALAVGLSRAGGAGSREVAARFDRLPGGKGAVLSFGTGVADAVVSTADGWSSAHGDLVRAPSAAASKGDARAFVQRLPVDFDNARVEADVEVEGKGTSEEPAVADLSFSRDDRQVAVRLALADDALPMLVYSAPGKGKPTQVEGPHASLSENRRYHLQLYVVNGHATALVDDRQVASAQVAGLTGVKAKVGFGCVVGSCRFSNVRVTGIAADAVAEKG